MDEAAIQRVVDFSKFLKKFADVVLNQQYSIVSIDTWTLYEIEEAFSLIFEVEKYTNFHVLPPSNRQHPSIPHIQFLYDILQKVKKLRILTERDRILPIGEQINLKCFRNLSSLELDSVPINQLKGLQNVRPVLKHLKVFNVCSQMNEILLKCGADMATEYLWENLETANFSRNHLSRLDSSLRLLPAIKELDLSYCELVDAISLFCLPTISKLNLSYNKLTSIPALSENASNVLLSLNLSNNLIIDLRGIERFITLEELNLKENFISVEQTLVHLNDLTNLKYLNILRNPITYGLNYRNHVLRCLHSSIRSCEQFILDDTALLFSERKVIGSTPERLQLKSSSSQLLKCLLDSVNKILKRQKTYCNRARLPPVAQLTQPVSSFKSCKSSAETDREESSSDNNTIKLPVRGSVRRKSRKNVVRHVSRPFEPPEDSSRTSEQPIEDSSNNSPISLERSFIQTSLSLSNKDESSANNDFFNEQRNNLNFPPSHLEPVEDPDLCTLTKAPSPSDKLLEEILNSHSQNLLNKSFSSPNQSILEPPDRTTINSSSFQECPSAVSSSNSSIYKLNDSFNLDVSPITTDDEEVEPQRELYSVIGKWENKVMDKNVEVDSDFVFLSFTPHFYKEKNGLSKGTMVKLNISSLQSMEVLSANAPIKVELNFNYPQPELSCRRFIFEEEDFKLLKDLIEPIIEKNNRNESKPPLPCSLCKLPFYGIKAQPSGTKDKKKFCKRCGNKKRKYNSLYEPQDGENIPEEDHSFIRNINSHDKESYPHQKKQSESSIPEGKTKNEKGTTSSDSSESVSICSSNGTSPSNQKQDHGSTPSLSSIEVLQENVAPDGEERRYYEKGTLVFELPVTAESNVDIRTPPDKSDIKILRFIDTNGTMGSSLSTDTAAMQESSSSGSMSGSVCTTVDRLSSGPSTPLRHDGGEQKLKGEFSDSGCETSGSVIKSPDEHTNLSSSIKSTDTVCHRPHSKSSKKTLKEVFEMFPEEDYDYDRKGIVLGDSSDVVSLKKWAEGLVVCYTGYSRESLMNTSEERSKGDSNRISDIPIFSYDDFTAVDHRLKLHCEVFLFTEHQEVLQGLFKAVVSTEDEPPFLGVLAISNRKIYVQKITSEENDSPQEWLEVNVVCYLEEVPSLYTVLHKQGVIVKFKEKMVLLCLADSQRSNAALYFILNCLDRFGFHPGVDDKFCRAQSENIRGQIEKIRRKFEYKYNPESRDNVHLFQNVTLMRRNGECSNHFLVLTSKHIFLFEADLSWLSASHFKSSSLTESIGESTTDLELTYYNRLEDVTQVDLYSDTHFQIEFYQQTGSAERPPWMIHVASPWVACNFIQTLRPLWEDEMKVDLDIICYSEDLIYIKEALRDTEFAPYIF